MFFIAVWRKCSEKHLPQSEIKGKKKGVYKMTGEEIYEIALSFVFERKRADADYLHFFPIFCNTVMQEAIAYENIIRRKNGKEAISLAPKITEAEMAKEIDYSESLCRVAIPYGIAAFYCQDDGDNYRAADYRNRFISALADAVGGVYISDVEDVYPYGAALDN